MSSDDYNYMKALWSHFYGRIPPDPISDELHHVLGEQLSKEQRKQLLRLVDSKNRHCEDVSLESFVAGFRLATGIAKEISGEWYDFDQDEEERVRK